MTAKPKSVSKPPDPGETAQANEKMRAMNEALILGSLRQHDLAAAADELSARLQAEISEHQQTEAALRTSEERHRALFTAVPVAVFVCDRSGVVQGYNNRAVELWGREPKAGDPAERYCGSATLYLPDGTLLPHAESPMVDVLRTGVAANNVEVLIGRPDGSRIAAIVNFAALKDAQGEITGVITSFDDITERKQAEVILREASERKSEFLAMLGHELRNPLAPISYAVEILKRPGGERELGTLLPIMATQLAQIIRLIDDLLDISRISTGKLQLRPQEIELASIVRLAAEAIRPATEAAQQALTVTLLPEPLYLHADPVRLAQVFGNLLSNACKFTPPGGCIALAAERQGDDAVVTIRDSGMGIPAALLPKIFEMYLQGDQTLMRAQSGLGIGLALVQRLVQRHGGSVQAFSAGPDKGSEFVVRLPLIDKRQDAG